MKFRSKLISAVIAAILAALTLAPMAFAAVDGAPLPVMQGASKRLEVYKKDNYGATDRTVLYKTFTAASSGNPDIAKIYQNGDNFYIAGLAIGNTTYSVTTASGETFSGTINVFKRWESPRVAWGGVSGGGIASVRIAYNGTYQVANHLGLTGAFTWSVSNANIGTVDNNGLFTAKGISGICVVTAKAANGATYSLQIEVVDPNAFTISPKTIDIFVGQSTTASAKALLSGNTLTGTWTVPANVTSANVGANPITLTGRSAGTGQALSFTANGRTDSATVNVYSKGFYLGSPLFDAGGRSGRIPVGFTASNLPSGLQALSWTSSSSDVSVDNNGYFWRNGGYAYAVSVTLTATSTAMNESHSVTITVY